MTIVITSKRDGFRRCGIAHPSTPTNYADDFFTEDQLEALSKEPQLIIAYAEDEFDQVQEQVNEPLSQAPLSQAPDALEASQSQAPQANAAPVGDAVVDTVVQVLGDGEPGPDAQGPGQVPIDGQPADDSPTTSGAVEAPVKPEKARSSKPKADGK
ncbi:HI1506-related protein [Pseudomonas sp. NR3]|uniref:HI1506-related protein n=1 Tax=Pseudomonas sp. NR3 TaxID=3155978 RepID=UPI003B67D431